MEEKRLIRKQIFAARKQCSDAQVEEWSHQITDQVLKLSEFVKAKHILAYADYNHEVMTRYIIEEAWKSGKEVAVPKVVGKDMVFYRLTDFSQLAPGYSEFRSYRGRDCGLDGCLYDHAGSGL